MPATVNEVFCISEESPRYSDTALEIHDKLINLIQKIEVLLYTPKGSLLCQPDFGVNLEKYIFETKVSADYIKNEINMQLWKYVLSSEDNQFPVTCDVNFYERTRESSFMCVVDIYIGDYPITSYAF